MPERKVSWWREQIMVTGMLFLCICGWLVGREYFNEVLNEIFNKSTDA